MWWIALYLPQWPLEALGAPAPDAVADAGLIVCCSPLAVQAGIQPRMSVAAAQARWPGIRVALRQPDQEARALRTMVLAVLRFSPHLCWRPDGFLIDVQASVRLFGGPLRLWQQFQQVVDAFKVSAHLAAAPHPEAAWLLARVRGPWRQQALDRRRPAGPVLGVAQSRQMQAVRPVLDALPLPAVLQAWEAPESVQTLLAGLGLDTLGAFRALPRAGLQRRLGAAWLERLDQAYGQIPDPRPCWVPPPVFDERLELSERSTDMAWILRALQQVLHGLEGWLCARGRLAQVLALHLQHEARRRESLPDTVHTLRLAAPERQAVVLQALWAERLGRHPLAAPVVAVRLVLHASEVPQTQDRQLPLITAAPTQPGQENPLDTRQALARLLDRLQSRLGPQAVQGLRQEDDHRPERASRLVDLTADEARPIPFGADASQAADRASHRPSPWPPQPTLQRPALERSAVWPQPLWLLPEPEPLGEWQGRPVHAGAPLTLRTPPERIEAGWFDGEPVCRDYHVAEGIDHRLRWVFRQRHGDHPGWFLHGWFN